MVICRALVDVFSDPFLSGALAFRGGTAIHKLANHLFLGTNGGTLCQNPETDAYVLMRPVPLAPLEGEEAVGAILEETLAQVERWRQNLNGMREAESTLDSQVAEERAAFGSGAFIQV